MSDFPHDFGVFRQRLRREVDDIAGRRAQPVEPVAGRLKGHAKMHGAELAGREAGDNEQRPAAPEILGLEATDSTMVATSAADRPTPPVKRAGMGRSTARHARIVKRVTLLELVHENALGLGPQVRWEEDLQKRK